MAAHAQIPDRPDLVAVAAPGAGDLRAELERDGVLIVDVEPFAVSPDERVLIDRLLGDGAKNCTFNPTTGQLGHIVGAPESLEPLRALMARFSDWSRQRIADCFPGYLAHLDAGRTSLRRRSVADEPPISARKDDRRLHVDAFTSQPVAGQRILRVFSNIDASGGTRDWAIADGGFERYANHFRGRARRLLPGEAAILEGLSLTKSRRTDYDQIMLGMHDAAKRDGHYQATAPRQLVSFPAGATWFAFTDQAPHAALAGQCALEQTFYLPVDALADPTASPLRVLERLWGKTLV